LNSVIAEFGSAVPLNTGVVTLVISSVDEMPLSEVATRSGVPGAAGAVVSMVTGSTLDATPTLPAWSVAFAVIVCVPSPRTPEVIDQRPAALAMPEPTAVAPSNNATFEFASAVPVNIGVVTLVVLSVAEPPLSEAVARSGLPGAAGAVVSIVTCSAPDAAPMLPDRSVAFAVMVCAPCASVVDVIDQAPVVLALPVPTAVVPSNNVTFEFASAVPVNTGVVRLVMLSVGETPLSETESRSGTLGAPGATGSTSVIPPVPSALKPEPNTDGASFSVPITPFDALSNVRTCDAALNDVEAIDFPCTMISSPVAALAMVAENPLSVPIVRVPVPSVNITDWVASTLPAFTTKSPDASISSTPLLPEGAVISGAVNVSVPDAASRVPALLIAAIELPPCNDINAPESIESVAKLMNAVPSPLSFVPPAPAANSSVLSAPLPVLLPPSTTPMNLAPGSTTTRLVKPDARITESTPPPLMVPALVTMPAPPLILTPAVAPSITPPARLVTEPPPGRLIPNVPGSIRPAFSTVAGPVIPAIAANPLPDIVPPARLLSVAPLARPTSPLITPEFSNVFVILKATALRVPRLLIATPVNMSVASVVTLTPTSICSEVN
jgi:hypothetical protein